LDLGDFVLGQIAAAVFAVFPGVEVVIGTLEPLADNAEGAVLHALNLKDLFNEGLRRERCFHGPSIDIHLYMATKNGANRESEEICPAHFFDPVVIIVLARGGNLAFLKNPVILIGFVYCL
jgi:hypothetical protein